jgi:hypothetical protein
VSALALASNPVYHARTKHIEVDYHFIHEKVLNGDLVLKFISTLDQAADIFTKGWPSARFAQLRAKLRALSSSIRLRRDVRGSSAPAGAHTAADFTTAEYIGPITSHAHTVQLTNHTPSHTSTSSHDHTSTHVAYPEMLQWHEQGARFSVNYTYYFTVKHPCI